MSVGRDGGLSGELFGDFAEMIFGRYGVFSLVWLMVLYPLATFHCL